LSLCKIELSVFAASASANISLSSSTYAYDTHRRGWFGVNGGTLIDKGSENQQLYYTYSHIGNSSVRVFIMILTEYDLGFSENILQIIISCRCILSVHNILIKINITWHRIPENTYSYKCVTIINMVIRSFLVCCYWPSPLEVNTVCLLFSVNILLVYLNLIYYYDGQVNMDDYNIIK